MIRAPVTCKAWQHLLLLVVYLKGISLIGGGLYQVRQNQHILVQLVLYALCQQCGHFKPHANNGSMVGGDAGMKT
jgi:hypothetical protein